MIYSEVLLTFQASSDNMIMDSLKIWQNMVPHLLQIMIIPKLLQTFTCSTVVMIGWRIQEMLKSFAIN